MFVSKGPIDYMMALVWMVVFMPNVSLIDAHVRHVSLRSWCYVCDIISWVSVRHVQYCRPISEDGSEFLNN